MYIYIYMYIYVYVYIYTYIYIYIYICLYIILTPGRCGLSTQMWREHAGALPSKRTTGSSGWSSATFLKTLTRLTFATAPRACKTCDSARMRIRAASVRKRKKRLYSGSIQALFRLYSGSIKALLQEECLGIKALLRLS